MTPRLKPLILPQLVEERRKRESQGTISTTASVHSFILPGEAISPAIATTATTTRSVTSTMTSPFEGSHFPSTYTSHSQSPSIATIPPARTTTPVNHPTEHDASSCRSDAPSPVTPTFSQGHSRYASSTSSFEMLGPYIPDYVCSPTTVSQKPGKRSLPDVLEDPMEQDEDTMLDEKLGLYDCLCDDDYCAHRDPQIVASPLSANSEDFADYGLGFGSDGEGKPSPWSSKKRMRDAPDSPLSGISRFSSRLPSFSRFRSPKRVILPVSPVSDLSLESYALSRDLSRSPSSSMTASGRFLMDRASELTMPPTPALSFLDSSESICIPQPIDIEKANGSFGSLEKDRSMATTPLLPPLMTAPPPPSQQKSQSQACLSPTTPQSAQQGEHQPMGLLPSPPLSNNPSLCDFNPIPALAAPSEIPSMVQDAWSDRLGHANFTIMPQPYQPQCKDMEALRQLRADWDDARIAYGKHIARVGEHYGHTSKTYLLSEAKWSETQKEWQTTHDSLIDLIADGAMVEDQALERVPVAVPQLHTMGNKFPSRGDEDIVGPMMRAVTKLPPTGGEERKGTSYFWRNLVVKVGLRR